MVTVALAGASTGFGLTMLRTFIHLNAQSQSHKVVLLSRSPQPQFTAQGVDVRPVDYTNHTELVEALKDVNTLLSCMGGSAEGMLDAQLALIEAAKEAGVRRWAPSEYAATKYEGVEMYKPKVVVWEATKTSGLEYTRFSCGLFMGLLATGTPKPLTEVGIREGCKTGEEEALSGVRPWNFVINIRAGTADWAEDGSTPIVWTDMRDIAQLVWRALELEEWPEEIGMRGDVKSFREIVEMLEEMSGRKFLTRNNDSEQLLEEGNSDPSTQFYNQARVMMQGGWGMNVGDELNKAFPDFKPITCEEFLQKWWSDVKFDEPAWGEDRAFGQRELRASSVRKTD